MRLGIFWNAIHDEEYALAKDMHDGQRASWRESFREVHTLQSRTTKVTDTFATLFRFADERHVDMCLLSFGNVWVMDPMRLRFMLCGDEIQKAAIAVRAGQIYAKAGVFSPKLPYIDADCILVNIQKCRALDIPKRNETIQSASHFDDAGGVHAVLIAWLETIVPYGACVVSHDGSALRDLYGRTRVRGFTPTPYLVDMILGCMSSDTVRDPRVHTLRARSIRDCGLDDTPLLAGYVEEYAGR